MYARRWTRLVAGAVLALSLVALPVETWSQSGGSSSGDDGFETPEAPHGGTVTMAVLRRLYQFGQLRDADLCQAFAVLRERLDDLQPAVMLEQLIREQHIRCAEARDTAAAPPQRGLQP